MFEKLALAETAPLIYPTITPNQHGFIPGRSTVTNLLSLQEYVLSAFEGGCPQVDCVYTDFSKAFDKLSHKHVLAVCQGKQTRATFKKTTGRRASQLLELLHADLVGPLPKTWGGAKYIFTTLDDFSRRAFTFFLKNKSEVLENFKQFRLMVENETGKHIKTLRTDNGGEFTGKNFENFLLAHRIKHQRSVPHTPEQNEAAERAQRSFVEKDRCLMREAHCSNTLWAKAVNTATYLYNRNPHKAVPGKTPEEVWSGQKVNLSHLKVWGCVAYAQVPKAQRKKWSPKSKPYMFV
ncbi:unnamed protein product [Nesidiocoris tenuis]|uniref:Integrase catalytic domain-containing protein n=1 Tax=Nesidiocoris tenuis TaxID=355587 RepID=A0A6H5H3B6_9HEMI|nr:unnamed protein product [Nesidiocoris tenuis]